MFASLSQLRQERQFLPGMPAPSTQTTNVIVGNTPESLESLMKLVVMEEAKGFHVKDTKVITRVDDEELQRQVLKTRQMLADAQNTLARLPDGGEKLHKRLRELEAEQAKRQEERQAQGDLDVSVNLQCKNSTYNVTHTHTHTN